MRADANSPHTRIKLYVAALEHVRLDSLNVEIDEVDQPMVCENRGQRQ